MPNLSLSLDADLLSQARAAAQRDRTTVNAIVRELLRHYTQSRPGLPEHELRRPEQASWRRELILQSPLAGHAG